MPDEPNPDVPALPPPAPVEPAATSASPAQPTVTATARWWRNPRKLIGGAAMVALCVACFAVGATVFRQTHGAFVGTQALMSPVQIASLKDWTTAVIKGRVAELFGSRFILDDGSGRALVDTGPAGEDGAIIRKDETITVGGRFEHGFVHAEVIVTDDGKTISLGPDGPPRGPVEWLKHFRIGAFLPGADPRPAT